MPNQVGTSQVIRFATFEVDLHAQELRKAGLRLKLTGQPFQVLAILLEQPGTVVTREELQKRLWPDTFGPLEKWSAAHSQFLICAFLCSNSERLGLQPCLIPFRFWM